MESFSKTLMVDAKGDEIYEALTESISEWWTKMFEGSAQLQNQTFTIRFGPQVFKTILVEELICNRKVVWRVVDAIIDLPELVKKKEWVDTRIIWEISGSESGSVLKLTHIGLNPDIECYNICVEGWRSFLSSLQNYLTTGVGAPFRLADVN